LQGTLWQQCLSQLENELPEQQFNTWIRPLHAIEKAESLTLLAPNRFVLDWVNELLVPVLTPKRWMFSWKSARSNRPSLNTGWQPIAENPGTAYNPLFIYGGVGLGKTHLMQAVGNMIVSQRPGAQVVYLHSERFVADMVKALQHNAMNEFKRYYRTVDALLIDDIQFFAGKERSQEEFFHTFNALLEGQSQIIMTCDRYPKEVKGLEERLKSRFGWGLTRWSCRPKWLFLWPGALIPMCVNSKVLPKKRCEIC